VDNSPVTQKKKKKKKHMRKLLLYDQPLLGPKPDQLLIFKRPQLALKLQCLLQPATSAAAKHSNLSVVNQAIVAMYEHPALHDHVAGWAPVRNGQHNAEVHLSFKDASAQHRQQKKKI